MSEAGTLVRGASSAARGGGLRAAWAVLLLAAQALGCSKGDAAGGSSNGAGPAATAPGGAGAGAGVGGTSSGVGAGGAASSAGGSGPGAAGGGGGGSGAGGSKPSGAGGGVQAPPWQHPTTDAEGKPIDVPGDLGAGALPPPTRGVRRMPIDTLQAAMTRVAGADLYGKPIRWRVNGKDGFDDGAFGKALGRPDFIVSTEEAGSSSVLYMKFVGDAARDICLQMATADVKRVDAKTRALFPKAPIDGTATEAQIAENLRYLLLRFLGVRAGEGDPMVGALRKVYDAGVASVVVPGGELNGAAEGWRGVCVALFESPLFHND